MTASLLATRSAGQALDMESDAWVRRLSGTGRERDDAIQRLHALLLRAARFEVGRRRPPVAVAGSDGVDDLAVQAADDALVAILTKLHTYRGDSRFTTWAYKFALLEAAVKLRGAHGTAASSRWRPTDGRSCMTTGELRLPLVKRSLRADPRRTRRDRRGADGHQRAVLVAITLNDVPIDVLAERRNTTRGALYKTLHDARRKLRTRLAEDGLALDPGCPGATGSSQGRPDDA